MHALQAFRRQKLILRYLVDKLAYLSLEGIPLPQTLASSFLSPTHENLLIDWQLAVAQ